MRRYPLSAWRAAAIISLTVVWLLPSREACAAQEPPKSGWVNQFPKDMVKLDSGRRNPLFYVGEPITFKLDGPAAERFEVRDFWGNVVDKGSAAVDAIAQASARWLVQALYFRQAGRLASRSRVQPVQRRLQYRQWYGDAVGGTTFVVLRDDPHFPKLPPRRQISGSRTPATK